MLRAEKITGNNDTEQDVGLDKSILYAITMFRRYGPFDGIIGFSKGAQVATQVAYNLGDSCVKCLILFGGVEPPEFMNVLQSVTPREVVIIQNSIKIFIFLN